MCHENTQVKFKIKYCLQSYALWNQTIYDNLSLCSLPPQYMYVDILNWNSEFICHETGPVRIQFLSIIFRKSSPLGLLDKDIWFEIENIDTSSRTHCSIFNSLLACWNFRAVPFDFLNLQMLAKKSKTRS